MFETNIKFLFFSTQLLLVLAIILFFEKKNPSVILKLKIRTFPFTSAFLLFLSVLVLFFDLFQITGFPSIFAIVPLSLFLPGYAFVKLIKIETKEDSLFSIVLSFLISLGLSSLVNGLLLSFFSVSKTLLCLFYLFVSLVLFLYEFFSSLKTDYSFVYKKISFRIINSLIFILIVLVFFVSIFWLYPQMGLSPGFDIVDHFSSIRLLNSAPDIYQSAYPWFHLPLVSIYALSEPSISLFQTVLACLSIIVILSFHLMARKYLECIENGAPLFATLFFSLFAGFGWLYLLNQKITVSPLEPLTEYLWAARDVSYWDISYGQGSWLWLWFRPMTLGFSLLFMLFYLIIDEKIQQKKYILIFSFLVCILGFVHLPELILFSIIFLVLSFSGNRLFTIRLKDSCMALIVGSITCLFLCFIPLPFVKPFINVSPFNYFILVVISLFSFFVHIIIPRLRTSNFIKIEILKRQLKQNYLYCILVILFVTSVLLWLAKPSIFSANLVQEIHLIPLYIYPVLLGVVGFLAVYAVKIPLKNHSKNNLKIIIIILIVTIVFGKAISLLNSGFTNFGYGERRFFPVVFAASSILASFAFLNIFRSIFSKHKKIISILAIFLIVTSGLMSTFLSIEYWIERNNDLQVSSNIIDSIEYLSNPNNRNFSSPILSSSSTSRSLASFIPTSYLVNAYRSPIWDSIYPEIPLMLLYNNENSFPYAFLTNQDVNNLFVENSKSNMLSTQLKFLNKEYQNPEVTIYQIPYGVPPSAQSDSVVIIPEVGEIEYFISSILLSQTGYSFSTCLESDIQTMQKSANLIFSRDDVLFDNLFNSLQSKDELGVDQQFLVFNLNGYGPFAEKFFDFSDFEKVVVDHISGFDFTFDLQLELDVSMMVENIGVNVLSWYSNGRTEIPFVAEMNINNKKVVYVNLFPFIELLYKNEFILENEQILNFNFDSILLNKLEDLSFYENDGYLQDGQHFISYVGGSVFFDGNETLITVPHSDVINPKDELSIEVWFSPSTPDDGFNLVSKKASYSSLDGYAFLFDGSSFYFNFGNGTEYFTNSIPYHALEPDVFYQVAVTYDGNFVSYYVNGDCIGSIAQTQKIAQNDLDLIIGKRHDDAWKFKGSLCKVKLYSKSLNSSEIENSYGELMNNYFKTNPTVGVLKELLGLIDLNLSQNVSYNSWVFDGNTAFFEQAIIEGKVEIHLSSLADFKFSNQSQINLFLDTVKTLEENVTGLTFCKFDDVSIVSEKIIINSGRGFYSNITVINPIFNFSDSINEILLTKSDCQDFLSFKNGSISILGSLDLYVRDAFVNATGLGEFKNFYSLFSLSEKLDCSGQSLTVSGTFQFNIPVSDLHTFISNVVFNGDLNRDPPPLQWNEFSIIYEITPWLLLMLMFLCIFGLSKTEVLSNPKTGVV